MKYLISSDWQFSDYARLSRITPTGITSRLQEFADCFSWMIEQATAYGVDEIAVLGDFFDNRVSVPVTVLDTTANLLQKCKEAGFLIHLLVGNHDAALKNSNITSLRVFEGLATIYAEPTVCGDLGFVPWYADNADLSEACEKVRDGGAKYLLSHIMVEGAVPKAKGVPVDILHADDFQRVLLGDVHMPVAVEPNIQYMGAPLQINFGDADQKRGVWFLDTDTDELEFIENTESPRFWNIDTMKDARKHKKEGGPGDYVKIRIEDTDEAERLYENLADGASAWVQNETVSIPDVAPRLNIRTQDKTESVLRKFCEHQEVADEEMDTLISLGMEILEDAKA